jgi:hypothetical protein
MVQEPLLAVMEVGVPAAAEEVKLDDVGRAPLVVNLDRSDFLSERGDGGWVLGEEAVDTPAGHYVKTSKRSRSICNGPKAR